MTNKLKGDRGGGVVVRRQLASWLPRCVQMMTGTHPETFRSEGNTLLPFSEGSRKARKPGRATSS